MAYIYKIFNDINNKLYIGKTYYGLDRRFREHCKAALKDISANRPLYRAMRKYGFDKFHIELVEETDKPEEREIYWINKLGTYHNGYNATLGGDGKPLIDYNLALQKWNEGLNCLQISKELACSSDQVSKILQYYGVNKEARLQRSHEWRYIAVNQYSKDGKLINSYKSIASAAKWLIDQNIAFASLSTIAGHIKEACVGIRKTCYGYFWKLATN